MAIGFRGGDSPASAATRQPWSLPDEYETCRPFWACSNYGKEESLLDGKKRTLAASAVLVMYKPQLWRGNAEQVALPVPAERQDDDVNALYNNVQQQTCCRVCSCAELD